MVTFQQEPDDASRTQDQIRTFIADALRRDDPSNGPRPPYEIDAEAREIFDRLCGHLGALQEDDVSTSAALRERGPGHFSFQHRTLQEFLVGRSFAENGSRWVEVLLHLDESSWREPILLCAGWIARSRGGDEASTFMSGVLGPESDDECPRDNAPLNDEDRLQRGLLFAADLLAEMSLTRPSKLRRVALRVTCRLEALLDEHQPTPLVDEALSRLGALACAGLAEAGDALLRAMNMPKPTVEDRQAPRLIATRAIQAVADLLQTTTIPKLLAEFLRKVQSDDERWHPGLLYQVAPRHSDAEALAIQALRREGPENGVGVRLANAAPPNPNLTHWPQALRQAHLDHAHWRIDSGAGNAVWLMAHAPLDARSRSRLLSLLRDEKHAADAAQALGGVVAIPEVRAALLDTLTRKIPRARELAATSLGLLAGEDAEVRTALIERVKTEEEGIPRRAALRALLSIGDHAEVVALLQRDFLDHQDDRQILEMLDRIRFSSTVAIPLLQRGLAHDHPEVRRMAARRSRDWVHAKDVGIVSLRKALVRAARRDVDEQVRDAALHALSVCVTEEPCAAAVARAQLSSRTLPAVAAMNVETLAPLALVDEQLCEALRAYARHPTVEVRVATARALARCPGEGVRATLLELLDDDSDDVRAEAATALTSDLTDEIAVAGLFARGADLLRLKSKALFMLALQRPHDERLHAVLQAGLAAPFPQRAAMIAVAALPVDDGLWIDAARILQDKPYILWPEMLDGYDPEQMALRLADLSDLWGCDRFEHTHVRTLIAIAPHSARVREKLRRNLSHPDATVKARAVAALARSADPADRDAISRLWNTTDPHLTAAMILHLSGHLQHREHVETHWPSWHESPHGSVRAAVARALADRLELRSDPVAELLPLLSYPVPFVQANAALALRHHVATHPGLINQLLPWLGASGSFMAWDTHRAHSPPAASVPRLEGVELRRALADGLAPLVPTSPALQEALTTMLASPDAAARQGAVWTLWTSGWGRDELLGRWRELLGDLRCVESVMLRIRAAGALLDSQDPDLRHAAHDVLVSAVRTGQEPWRGRGALMDASPDTIRLRALEYLVKASIELRSEPALQAIRAACDDLDPKVRDAGWRALNRIRGLSSSPVPSA